LTATTRTLFSLLLVTACGAPAPSQSPETVAVPPAPESASPTPAPPASSAPVTAAASDPEPFAVEFFKAAWSGDEAKVRARMASYEVFSGLSQREITADEYREKVDGFLHDFLVPPGATPNADIAGAKVMLHKQFSAGDEKLRRAAELAIVRPILTKGGRTEVAPFNFVMLRTETGWLMLPGE
jgi:hypothetical protein